MIDTILSLPRKFYGYLKKDIILLVKRKKYLYLTILLPMIIAGIFLLMLNPSGTKIKVAVCDFDSTEYSIASFSHLDGFDTRLLDRNNCTEKLMAELKSGKVALGLKIDKGFTANLKNSKQEKITIYYDNTDIALSKLIEWKVDSSLAPYRRSIVDSLNNELKEKVASLRISVDLALALTSTNNVLNSKIKGIDSDLKRVEQLDTDFLVNPIWTEKKPIYNQKLNKDAGIAFIFPIIALFIILMLSSTSLIYDRNTNFLVRVKSSTSPILYIIAKMVFFFMLTLVQFLIIILLFIIYGSTYYFNMMGILHLIFFVSVINSLFGLLIGTISDNEGIALLFSLMVSFPLMLLSGIFFPIQTMPVSIQYMAKILPLSYQITATKSILLFGSQISAVWIYPAIGLFIAVYYLIRAKSN